MKKRLLATLCLASVLSLAACSKPAEKAESKGEESVSAEEKGTEAKEDEKTEEKGDAGEDKTYKVGI